MSNHRALVAQRRALVSVIITTYNRPELLTLRCLPSVLGQTHHNLDVHVVGDGAGPEVVAAMATVTDPRVRFTNRPRPEYPPGELDAWHVSGSWAANYGLDHVRGEYVCGIGDDDEYMPEFVEVLLNGLIEQRVGLIYCISEIIGTGRYLGCDFPPRFAGQSGESSCGDATTSVSILNAGETANRTIGTTYAGYWSPASRSDVCRAYSIATIRVAMYPRATQLRIE